MLDLESYFSWVLNQRSTKECVHKLVSDDDPVRAVFLCGKGKCGKSTVLRWFSETHRTHVFGEDVVSFGPELNAVVLVEEIADCFREAGVELIKFDALPEMLSVHVETYIEGVSANNSPESVFSAETNFGSLSQILMPTARRKLRALFDDLDKACSTVSLNGYLLFDGFDEADPEVQQFFKKKVLRGLSKYPGLRFVVEDGPYVRKLEQSVSLDPSCSCLSAVLSPTINTEDIIIYFNALPPRFLAEELWWEKANQIIEETQGFPNRVISELRSFY